MPTTNEIDYLDGEFQVSEQEPATIAEVIEIIGENGVVDETVSNLRYRNKYPRVYKKVAAEVEAKGFERNVQKEETRKDGTVKKIMESDTNYLRRYLASGDEARTVLGDLFANIASSEPLYVKGERAGGQGKIAQAALDAATALFEQVDEKVEQVIASIESNVPGYKVGRDSESNATVESVARGISAFQKHLAKNAFAQLGVK